MHFRHFLSGEGFQDWQLLSLKQKLYFVAYVFGYLWVVVQDVKNFLTLGMFPYTAVIVSLIYMLNHYLYRSMLVNMERKEQELKEEKQNIEMLLKELEKDRHLIENLK